MRRARPRVRRINSCPICRVRNHPGSGATCEHYLGTVRKRELIWSDHGAEFAAAWTAVRDVVFLAHRNPHVVAAVLHSACPCASPEVRQVIESGVLHDDPFFWVDDTEQSRAETGRLGGCGYSLYHPDPEFLAKVIGQLHEAARWIAATVRGHEVARCGPAEA